MSELLRQQQRAKEIRDRLYGKPKIVNIAVQKRKITETKPEPEPEVKIEFPEYSFEDHSMIGPFDDSDSMKILKAINLIKAICVLTPYTYEDIVGPKSHKDIAMHRRSIIRTVYAHYPNLTVVEIGEIFNRHHTTILHSLLRTKASKQIMENRVKRAS